MDRGMCFKNLTALHAAVISSNTSIVSYLVTHVDKFDPDATIRGAQHDYYASFEGATALHLAVGSLFGAEQLSIVSCLLTHGADWSVENASGKQCRKDLDADSDVDLARILIEYGVGMNSTYNSKSSTIVHLLASSMNVHSRNGKSFWPRLGKMDNPT